MRQAVSGSFFFLKGVLLAPFFFGFGADAANVMIRRWPLLALFSS
jgi:hypothetical protein